MEKIKDKVFVYFHICMINNWEEVTYKILNEIINSGLIDIIDKIFFYVLGDITKNNLSKLQKLQQINSKFKVNSVRKEVQTYEKLTINSLLEDCKNKYENCKILYLHSKGITRVGNKNVEDWVDFLVYFNVNKHKDCINALENYDTCGVNLTVKPRLHYSGNFWWANSDYIKKLNPLIVKEQFLNFEDYRNYYLDAEMWICSKTKKCISLHNSNLDHYHNAYNLSNYKDKVIYTETPMTIN